MKHSVPGTLHDFGTRALFWWSVGLLGVLPALAENQRAYLSAKPTEAVDNTAAEMPPAVFARGKLDVDGEIIGRAWAGRASDARLGAAARISDSLWLAPAAVTRKAGDTPTAEELTGRLPKTGARSNLATRVEGRQESLPTLPGLPRIPLSPVATGTDVTVAEGTALASWREVRHITVRRKSDVALPPGDYGDVVVEQGSLSLGEHGTARPSRYVFRSLTVRPSAQLRVVEPVVLLLGADSSLSGEVGHPMKPEWLDVRITKGSLVIHAGCQVFGVILASSGSVQVGNGAQIVGAVAGNDVTLGTKSRVSAAMAEGGPLANQPFLAKALRVESRIAALARRHRYDYSIAAS